MVKCVFVDGDLAFDLPDGEELDLDITIKLNGRLQQLIDERVRAGIEATFNAHPVFADLVVKDDVAWVSVGTDLDQENTYIDLNLAEALAEFVEQHEKDRLAVLRKCLSDAIDLIDKASE